MTIAQTRHIVYTFFVSVLILGDYDLRKYDWASLLVVANCIKQFFKDLAEPVVPTSLQQAFIDAARKLAMAL